MDMSQGDLPARIHFFFFVEGGYPEMCEVSEKIYNEGIINEKKKTAFNVKKGYSDVIIADILEIGINVIQQWLSGSKAAS